MSDRGDQLLTELRVHLAIADVRLSEPLQPLAVGYSNEIARFRLQGAPPPFDQPLVLRVTHDPRETAREAIIEDGVAELGCPAPAVLLRGGPSSALGAPFLITALSPGVALDDTITARTAIGAFRRVPTSRGQVGGMTVVRAGHGGPSRRAWRRSCAARCPFGSRSSRSQRQAATIASTRPRQSLSTSWSAFG
jgi:hypothetical protein